MDHMRITGTEPSSLQVMDKVKETDRKTYEHTDRTEQIAPEFLSGA